MRGAAAVISRCNWTDRPTNSAGQEDSVVTAHMAGGSSTKISVARYFQHTTWEIPSLPGI